MASFLRIQAGLALSIDLYAQSYTISTYAGTVIVRDGGPATATLLQKPESVAIDANNNVYIADAQANRVRKVSPTGVVSTVAGTGHPGFSGDGGPATMADLSGPISLAIDKSNNLY